uniref:Uncharacterized protein n=1 Tax=Polytomella parva TaxID=51329 RepID=A0A7S0VUT3_9CHLO|eukprot:CAMPEP_0175079654 /NCGR_PEP_ID=MMETSP0052_2-20121109/24954_1 /TAXON_ID=51329 ORGANISM="Polytomella parva, Strain SAG 63-3" /NCGR_SAMPLE_ID=MMETSP0052_2 /ASSEMBLY_ACC=CAM_ASM_000194 /LENGTH=155 /DNA_ID=CAMNT_0016350031 /DNA_START=42 /DNA_END=509 /DNA_ORIENTATION=-
MPGTFVFKIENSSKYVKEKYLAAISETRKLENPPDLYVSYGPEEMGVAMVIKVSHKPEWTLVLPSDPLNYPLECGFTYGVVSRIKVWEYLREVIVILCRQNPGLFEFHYEDKDLGDYHEAGFYDVYQKKIVVKHIGLPSASDFERSALMSRKTAQ